MDYTSTKLRRYLESLKSNGLQLKETQEEYRLEKQGGEVLFSLLMIAATTPEGEHFRRLAMVRGHFVSILTLLKARETGEEYLVLVGQRRVATGGIIWEHPAGMLDEATDPAAVAVKELAEETGLVAKPEELVLLDQELVYSSPGLLDEGGYFFCLERDLPLAEIEQLEGKHTGAATENESIRLTVVPFSEAMEKIGNVNGRYHIYRYMAHKHSPKRR